MIANSFRLPALYLLNKSAEKTNQTQHRTKILWKRYRFLYRNIYLNFTYKLKDIMEYLFSWSDMYWYFWLESRFATSWDFFFFRWNLSNAFMFNFRPCIVHCCQTWPGSIYLEILENPTWHLVFIYIPLTVMLLPCDISINICIRNCTDKDSSLVHRY